MKKLTIGAVGAALLAASLAQAQAPLMATVLATQPHVVQSVVEEEKCSLVSVETPERDAESRRRVYMAVGAVAGGVALAAATQSSGAGTQLAATGLGALAGAFAGKKIAESQHDKVVWAFDEPKGKKVTPVPLEANQARPCTVVETVRETQDGYISLISVRGKEMVVNTAKPLTQGSSVRVYTNHRGEMEMLP